MEKIVIDLADPNTRGAIAIVAMGWGIAVLVTLYSIVTDVSALVAARKSKKNKS